MLDANETSQLVRTLHLLNLPLVQLVILCDSKDIFILMVELSFWNQSIRLASIPGHISQVVPVCEAVLHGLYRVKLNLFRPTDFVQYPPRNPITSNFDDNACKYKHSNVDNVMETLNGGILSLAKRKHSISSNSILIGLEASRRRLSRSLGTAAWTRVEIPFTWLTV